MTQETKIKAGQVVTLTSGEYSDYGIETHLTFRKDCDLEDLLNTYGHEARAERDDTPPMDTNAAFIAWLVVNEWAVEFTTTEIHIGSYGDTEIGQVRLGYGFDQWTLK